MFGAVYQPLASCMVVQFHVYVSWWQLECTSDIVERNFLLISCLYSCFYAQPIFAKYFLPKYVLLCNNLNIKYFVLTYSIDVVSTLSYQTCRISLIISILCEWWINYNFVSRNLSFCRNICNFLYRYTRIYSVCMTPLNLVFVKGFWFCWCCWYILITPLIVIPS